MKLKNLLLPVALLALVATVAQAQDASLGATIVSVTGGEYPQAQVIVNIEDRSGELPNLDASNFVVNGPSGPLKVTSADLANSEEAPLDLLISVDTSGSMAGDPINNAKAAARALVDSLPPTDRVGVIGFGDVVTILQDYTADRALVYRAIDSLAAQGNTALFQATAVSAVHVTTSSASRRAVILLSDGADFGGRSIATRDESLAAANGVGVPFFTIAQGSDLDRPYLVQLAEATKGRFLEAPQPQDLKGLYLEVGRLLKSQYVVKFDASSIATAPESEVAITVTAGGRVATSKSPFRPGPGFAPAVSLSGVIAGDAVSEPRQVLVSVPSSAPGTTVTWFLDGTQVGFSDAAPYLYSFDPKSVDDGAHTLRAVVGGASAPSELSVAFDSVPPVPVAGGGANMPLILGGVGAVIGALIAFLMMKRSKRMRVPATINPDQRVTPWAKQIENARRAAVTQTTAEVTATTCPEQQDIDIPLGVLISRAGTDLGREYTVGAQPVAIGSGVSCGVCVDDPLLAVEEARVWVRDGHMMVHKISRLSMEADPEESGGWVILEPGDSFPIGQHTFEFRLLERRAKAADSTPVPNVLRDPEPEQRLQSEPIARLRMPELMPKSDGGFTGAAD